MEVSLRGLGVASPEMIGYTPVLTRAVANQLENPTTESRRPTIAECYAGSSGGFCRATTNAICYGPGFFTDFCATWRNYQPGSAASGIPLPPSIKPPAIDTNRDSPTYGQAMIDGHVVDSVEDAQRLIDAQIAEQHAAQARQTQVFFEGEAAGACALKADECGIFTSVNADCTDCVFDPTKPAFLLIAFTFVALLIAKPWK